MLKVPKKGSTEWIKLADLFREQGEKSEDLDKIVNAVEGVEFGVLHKGRSQASTYSFRAQALRNGEQQRVFELRKKYTRDQAPELWEKDYVTEDYARDLYLLCKEIVGEYSNGVRGVEGFGSEYEPKPGELLPDDKRKEVVDMIEDAGFIMDLHAGFLSAQGLNFKEVLS